MQLSNEGDLPLVEPRSPTVVDRFRQGNLSVSDIYLDANATVKPLNSVVEAVTNAMRNSWGNPSSEHYASVAARGVLERARNAVSALLLGVDPDDVILTSGGTESSNAVLASADADATVVVSAVEHSASVAPAELAVRRGAKLIVVPVGADGLADPDAFRRAAVESPSARLFVSIQWANGETGVIQPIHEIASAVHETRPDAVLHVDAAQAVGRIPTTVPPKGGMTALSFSGHKLHGPQGTGVLAFSGGGGNSFAALIVGGG